MTTGNKKAFIIVALAAIVLGAVIVLTLVAHVQALLGSTEKESGVELCYRSNGETVCPQ